MKYKYFLIILFFLFGKPVFAQDDQLLGEIRLFAGNYAPQGWLPCDGRLLSIQNYNNLYSILQNKYGGDGVNNFALPNLNGNLATGAGAGPGLQDHPLGKSPDNASNSITITTSNLPAHTHSGNLKLSTEEATSTSGGSDKYLAAPNNVFIGSTRTVMGYGFATQNIELNTATTSSVGVRATTPIPIMQPTLTMMYIIAIGGEYPQR